MTSRLQNYAGQKAAIERYADVWQLQLGRALLAIYNPAKVEGAQVLEGEIVPDLILLGVDEDDEQVVFNFDGGIRLTVDLSNAAFRGPEAMELTEDGHVTVWQ